MKATKLREYKRTLTSCTKPTKQQFRKIFTVVGLGIVLIGGIGFIVALVYGLF